MKKWSIFLLKFHLSPVVVIQLSLLPKGMRLHHQFSSSNTSGIRIHCFPFGISQVKVSSEMCITWTVIKKWTIEFLSFYLFAICDFQFRKLEYFKTWILTWISWCKNFRHLYSVFMLAMVWSNLPAVSDTTKI